VEFPFPRTIAIAHRGAHDSANPQNSLGAVEQAVRIGAPAVEFDVCNLGDGVWVVTHDRAAATPSMPRVEPFLEVVAGSSLMLNFDWKGKGQEEKIGRLLASFKLIDRTIVSTGDTIALTRIKEASPEVITGLSWDSPIRAIGRASGHSLLRESRADALMLDYRIAAPEVVEAVRRAQAGLFLWTASDTATFYSLLSLRPDGIATDVIKEQLAQATR
jgi:glycerophosphoryl diester phosphodiesterase